VLCAPEFVGCAVSAFVGGVAVSDWDCDFVSALLSVLAGFVSFANCVGCVSLALLSTEDIDKTLISPLVRSFLLLSLNALDIQISYINFII
jgi:hypothetical protein